MDISAGDWGLFQWFEEHGLDLIHPDDRDSMRQLMPNGKLFEVIGKDGGYITLRYAEHRYRVKPALFRPVSAPPFSFGGCVRIRKGGNVISATICDIMWHFQKAEPFYYLWTGGKRLKKQYWSRDFLDDEEQNNAV
jgi:hypothetical protein